jgi:hypothetical protein
MQPRKLPEQNPTGKFLNCSIPHFCAIGSLNILMSKHEVQVIFIYTIQVVMVLRQIMVKLCAKRAQHGQVADSGRTNSADKWIFLS